VLKDSNLNYTDHWINKSSYLMTQEIFIPYFYSWLNYVFFYQFRCYSIVKYVCWLRYQPFLLVK